MNALETPSPTTPFISVQLYYLVSHRDPVCRERVIVRFMRLICRKLGVPDLNGDEETKHSCERVFSYIDCYEEALNFVFILTEYSVMKHTEMKL